MSNPSQQAWATGPDVMANPFFCILLPDAEECSCAVQDGGKSAISLAFLLRSSTSQALSGIAADTTSMQRQHMAKCMSSMLAVPR